MIKGKKMNKKEVLKKKESKDWEEKELTLRASPVVDLARGERGRQIARYLRNTSLQHIYLGTLGFSKMDEFPEKVQRGGGKSKRL